MPGLSKGMFITPDATARNNNQAQSKKFMATSDYSMYDPVKKAQLKHNKQRGSSKPSELTSDLQDMMKVDNTQLTARAKKRANPNFTATAQISPSSIMSPKKNTFARAGSIQLHSQTERQSRL